MGGVAEAELTARARRNVVEERAVEPGRDRVHDWLNAWWRTAHRCERQLCVADWHGAAVEDARDRRRSVGDHRRTFLAIDLEVQFPAQRLPLGTWAAALA